MIMTLNLKKDGRKYQPRYAHGCKSWLIYIVVKDIHVAIIPITDYNRKRVFEVVRYE